jgi:serine/threonine protein kinase
VQADASCRFAPVQLTGRAAARAANVLLKATSADRRGYLCKLGDFGLARLLDPTQHTHVSTQTYGTMPYMSPELIAHARLTQLNDVYSFGIVMWQLYTGESPFANLTLGALFFAVVHEKRRPELTEFEAAIARGTEHSALLAQYSGLMQRCWHHDPTERPNFMAIMSELGRLLRAARAKAAPAPTGGGAGALRSSASAPGQVGEVAGARAAAPGADSGAPLAAPGAAAPPPPLNAQSQPERGASAPPLALPPAPRGSGEMQR